MTASLSLTVNGEPRRTAAATIAALVRELELKPEKVAVERNGVIVPRSTLGEAPLADGDVLEIVTFVGGGDHFAPAIACSFLPSPLAGEEGAPSGAEGEGSAAQAAAGAADPSPNPLPQGERAE